MERGVEEGLGWGAGSPPCRRVLRVSAFYSPPYGCGPRPTCSGALGQQFSLWGGASEAAELRNWGVRSSNIFSKFANRRCAALPELSPPLACCVAVRKN